MDFRMLLMAAILMLAVSCAKPEANRVDLSIDKAFNYLHEIQNDDYSYDDQYLLYIYGDERLECPAEDCNITYRILDAFFNLRFIKLEFSDYSIIQEQVDDADRIMNALLPVWERGRIYNIQNQEMKDPAGFALDTYCILGYLYSDKAMAETAKKSLLGLEWEPEEFYNGYEEFRHIADEAWCTRLMIAAKVDNELSRVLTEKSVNETDYLLQQDEPYLLVPRINAVYHTLFLIQDLDDPAFEKDRQRYQQFLIDSIDEKRIENDTLTYANILDILLYSGYKERPVLDRLAGLLLERQEPQGQWHMQYNEKEDNGQVFATFRAAIALNKYRMLLE